MTYPIRTVLWFNGHGREAAEFYCSLIPGSQIESGFSGDSGGDPGGTFEVIDFTLGTTPYQILDAGPHFPLSECVSILVQTPDQRETDRLWDALIAGNGAPAQCGWLKDRFGLSWQIVPERAMALMTHADRGIATRALQAVMGTIKIDVATLEAAVETAAHEDA